METPRFSSNGKLILLPPRTFRVTSSSSAAPEMDILSKVLKNLSRRVVSTTQRLMEELQETVECRESTKPPLETALWAFTVDVILLLLLFPCCDVSSWAKTRLCTLDIIDMFSLADRKQIHTVSPCSMVAGEITWLSSSHTLASTEDDVVMAAVWGTVNSIVVMARKFSVRVIILMYGSGWVALQNFVTITAGSERQN